MILIETHQQGVFFKHTLFLYDLPHKLISNLKSEMHRANFFKLLNEQSKIVSILVISITFIDFIRLLDTLQLGYNKLNVVMPKVLLNFLVQITNYYIQFHYFYKLLYRYNVFDGPR